MSSAPVTLTTSNLTDDPAVCCWISSRRAKLLLASIWSDCLVNSQSTDADTPSQYTLFHSCTIPEIGLSAYAEHILKVLSLDRACLGIALCLMQRYWNHSGFLPSELSVHRLLAASLFVAMKLHHDRVWRSHTFADVCGVRVEELVRLEVTLVVAISFTLHVSADDVVQIRRQWSVTSPSSAGHNQSITSSQDTSLNGSTSVPAGSGMYAIHHLRDASPTA